MHNVFSFADRPALRLACVLCIAVRTHPDADSTCSELVKVLTPITLCRECTRFIRVVRVEHAGTVYSNIYFVLYRFKKVRCSA